MKHIRPYGIFEASAAAPAALTPEQMEWLNECTKGTWKLNHQTGLVDVDGRFDCSEQGLSDFKGVRFGVVERSFWCENNLLTSLVGAPEKVKGSFWCENNRLTSLEGAPREVGRDFRCYNNLLTSLVGAPQKVEGDFYCRNNQLTTLEGAPREVGESFYCYDNRLTSLEGAPREVRGGFSCDNNLLTSLVGAPEKVGVGFYCSNNLLTSLEGAPQKVGSFSCNNNRLTSLEGAPREVRGSFDCDDNPVPERTLKSIFSHMGRGGSYLKAVEYLWPKIPVDDQALLYRPEFKWVGAEEAKKLQAVGRFNKIKGIL